MTEATVAPSELSVTINGRSVAAQPGELLIAAAERAGTFIPRFCYHPRMASVGICRMCLVEVDGPRGATLQPACYLTVNDGMNVVTDSPKVKKAQDGVLEFLLANHPLDCPVCDKGGECPLQDQTLTHGSGETRFLEEKRHFAKPISIGELVLLDRERCIQCARCTRFASEVAGEATIDFAGRGDQLEVAPFPTEPFDSVFSGNTVQICPVGALTAKPYRFAARPWDLEQVESTCTTCAVGCRVAVQSSGNRLTRVLGIDSEPVNHGWLCDKGRFAIEAVDAEDATGDLSHPATRLREPMVRRDGVLVPVSWGEALGAAADILRAATADGADGVGAIGGAALTNEGAFAWERLLRGVLGANNVDAQYGDGLDAALLATLPRATIDEACRARTVVLLCGDLREELPVLFLRLRGAAVQGHVTLLELSTGKSALHSLSTISLPTRPGEAHLVARALASEPSAMTALASHPHGVGFSDIQLADARARLDNDGDGVVFVVGRTNAAESPAIVEAAIRTFATHFRKATFLTALRRGNVVGALDMGLSPALRPGRVAANDGAAGRDAVTQLRALADGTQHALVLLGGALVDNVADAPLAAAALSRARVIAVTGHGSADLAHCDVVLPATVAHERTGTVTNIEGRVSALVPKLAAPGSAWSDVAIASELAEILGQSLGLDSVESTASTIETSTGYPALSVLRDEAHEGTVAGRHRDDVRRRPMDPIAFPGVLRSDVADQSETTNARAASAMSPRPSRAAAAIDVPAVPLADSYSLRVVASRRLYDRGVAVVASPALAALIAPFTVRANGYDLDRIGVTTGDVVRVVTPRGSFESPVTVDPAVTRGTVEIPVNVGNDDAAQQLFDPDALVTELRLESR